MNEHGLNIEYIETKNGNFHKITCPENHFITSWRDGDDILEFNASKIVCCPLKVDIDATYRCIDDETYAKLEGQREAEERIKMEEMNKRNEDMR